MTNKKILDEVYRRLCFIADNMHLMDMDRMFDKVHDMKDLIEQEWQREDDRVTLAMYNRNRPIEERAKSYDEMIQRVRQESILITVKATPDSLDDQEIQRSQGLEIGPDGTVKD